MDPLRFIAIPSNPELDNWGSLDPSQESDYTVMPGLEYKYEQTAVLLVSGTCAGICRYCFRKRIFLEKRKETLVDLDKALEYISEHPEINNVLLTGGDPLMLSTSKLDHLLSKLREIDHVQIIRIGSKVPAVNPYRIIDDPQLSEVLAEHMDDESSIYVMTHFTHPREINEVSIEAVSLLKNAGALLNNQTPLLRNVNADPRTLSELLNRLSYIGVAPYYVFQCRPAVGNRHFVVPVEESYRIIEEAKNSCSGLAKRVRYVISHRSGKVEVLAIDEENVYMKYHQAADRKDAGRFLVLPRNPRATWLDDYLKASPTARQPRRGIERYT